MTHKILTNTVKLLLLFAFMGAAFVGLAYVDMRQQYEQMAAHNLETGAFYNLKNTKPSATSLQTHPLVAAAREQIGVTVTYNASYQRLDYPMGDVPLTTGVCTDVVVRAYRELGADLQQQVHEDMRTAWSRYPKQWGLAKPDTNIDHRRVPNLEVYFQRHGKSLPVSSHASDYQAGDLVTWRLSPPHGLPHIGIVSDHTTRAGTPLIIHNIGRGTEESDILFAYTIAGHFRYNP